MAFHQFLTTDQEQVVARWLKENRCEPIALAISVKFYTDLDTYIDLPTCEQLLSANKHHIKKANGRSTNPPRTSKTL